MLFFCWAFLWLVTSSSFNRLSRFTTVTKGLLWFSLLATLGAASPARSNRGLKPPSLEARQQNFPFIKWPYGTWQASKYDSANDVRPSMHSHPRAGRVISDLALRLQNYSLRSPTSRSSEIGQTNSSQYQRGNSEGRLWPAVCSLFLLAFSLELVF